MRKLFELFGLNPPQYKFSDFETNLRFHYLVNFGLDILLALCVIIFGISSNYFLATILFVGIVIILCLYHVYALLQLLGGQVVCFEGKCSETNKQVASLLKKQFFGKSNISVVYNDKTYLIPVRHDAPFKEGVIARIYFVENNIYPKDEDTFTIPYPIYVSKVKNAVNKDI